MRVSKSTLKRHCFRFTPMDDRWSSPVRGTSDAITDARRALRAGVALAPHPDGEDFFGVRLSDSPTGDRYVRAFDEAIEIIATVLRRARRRSRRFRKEVRHAA